MWSDNKNVDTTINVLLFFLAVNLFHYGQIFVPVICLIIFVDNEFKFKVNSLKTFFVLCLFAISFLAFTYKTGIYCVAGLFLPMAYYIGSNMHEVNETNLKRLFYKNDI